jgi:hypothetical protein
MFLSLLVGWVCGLPSNRKVTKPSGYLHFKETFNRKVELTEDMFIV